MRDITQECLEGKKWHGDFGGKKQNKTSYQLKLTLAWIFLVPRPSKWFLLQRKALLLCTEVQGQTVKELWPGMNKWRSIPKGSEVLPGEQRGQGWDEGFFTAQGSRGVSPPSSPALFFPFQLACAYPHPFPLCWLLCTLLFPLPIPTASPSLWSFSFLPLTFFFPWISC